MSYTAESDDHMHLRIYDESPAGDNSCRSRGKGSVLKKGPWTSAEDGILINYVRKHGEGNWSAVQKYTSLARCGKSCRLRWANHLRPNLKKGAFSQDEERLIVQMHAKMGNKWAHIAEHVMISSVSFITNQTTIKANDAGQINRSVAALKLWEYPSNGNRDFTST
ncbi:hypothetical protein Bca52824_066845 [Brassica carinata]|uniref:Uncharacterized protein n=1 Tax=Brassica carinata TaxID=52824 RepID=A0A8X7QPX2_BRACI|nr:hypothetical protein Bca52824_066845 [Brassica carinata]